MNAVDEYLDLTAQIKVLTDKRRELSLGWGGGRYLGSGDKDIRVSYAESNKISMSLLRRYVTPDVIRMCQISSYGRSVAVVSKVKPKVIKEKKRA